ncbi:MAG: putative phosphotransacetylase, partial [Clostridia bacterium]|nr:putative phosphotransacetylase [Clostridia bacterium]
GPRGIIMDNVLVRVKPTYKLEMHVDTDEANAALLKNGDKCRILH